MQSRSIQLRKRTLIESVVTGGPDARARETPDQDLTLLGRVLRRSGRSMREALCGSCIPYSAVWKELRAAAKTRGQMRSARRTVQFSYQTERPDQKVRPPAMH